MSGDLGSVGTSPSPTDETGGATASAVGIPNDLAKLIGLLGEVEWGATAALSADEHADHVRESVKMTAEHFLQSGPQPMNGLYLAGTETVLCHTGTSPNSGQIARALTAAWNRLVAEASNAPVAPEARATAKSSLSAEGVRDAGEASGQPTGPQEARQ